MERIYKYTDAMIAEEMGKFQSIRTQLNTCIHTIGIGAAERAAFKKDPTFIRRFLDNENIKKGTRKTLEAWFTNKALPFVMGVGKESSLIKFSEIRARDILRLPKGTELTEIHLDTLATAVCAVLESREWDEAEKDAKKAARKAAAEKAEGSAVEAEMLEEKNNEQTAESVTVQGEILTEDEKELLTIFRNLDAKQRAKLAVYMSKLVPAATDKKAA